MKADERAKTIEKALRLTWASLESHLIFCYHPNEDGKAFHKSTIGEYADLIKLLSELY